MSHSLDMAQLPTSPRTSFVSVFFHRASKNRGLAMAFSVFLVAFLVLSLYLPNGYGYSDLAGTSAGAATLALAAIGQTLVIISGGLDLSAGSVISLSNALLVTQSNGSIASEVLWSLLAIAIGGCVGFVNGAFIVRLKLQPVVVTLATMFITQGITLLLLKQPGGSVAQGFSEFFTGNAIEGLLPMPLVVILGAMLIWYLIRNSVLGMRIYAAGSDSAAAQLRGLQVDSAKLLSYVIAGCFYGAAGVFLTAQTGSGDPLIGASMLLPIFVASVLGGTPLGGGRGGCVGSVIGAFTVTLIANILLLADVSTYYSTVVEGSVLIVAMLGNSYFGGSDLKERLHRLMRGARHRHPYRQAPALVEAKLQLSSTESVETAQVPRLDWWQDHKADVLLCLPAYAGLAVLAVITAGLFQASFAISGYLTSLLLLSSFLIVLAAGQGAVVLSGGLDLSVPCTITLCAVLLTSLADGSNSAAIWVIPLVIAVGAGIGLLNGIGVHFLGISPFLMTLAMNGILQGIALGYCGGSPTGLAPPALKWMLTGHVLGVAPVLLVLPVFVIVVGSLLHKTVFGRRLFAVGSNVIAARFAAVPVGKTLISTYAFSGLCSAVTGILLAGFTGQAFMDMGDPYLLTSIAVVVVGGTAMSGGKGHYAGMVGGALMLTALATLLSGTTLPPAARSVIYGLVVLVAVVSMRSRAAKH